MVNTLYVILSYLEYLNICATYIVSLSPAQNM